MSNVYQLPQDPERLIRWHAERAEKSMEDEEAIEIMNRARAAQMAVDKILEEMEDKEEVRQSVEHHSRCFVTPGVHHEDCPLSEKTQKHTLTDCWCGQSWDLR